MPNRNREYSEEYRAAYRKLMQVASDHALPVSREEREIAKLTCALIDYSESEENPPIESLAYDGLGDEQEADINGVFSVGFGNGFGNRACRFYFGNRERIGAASSTHTIPASTANCITPAIKNLSGRTG